MKIYGKLHVVAFVAAMMALGAQATPMTDGAFVLRAVSAWSAANGDAFANPGTANDATPVYDDDGATVLYWIVTMSNGGAVIASADTDLDLVVSVLEQYDGPLPEGHPLPDILKNDMRNRLAVLAKRTAANRGVPRLRAAAGQGGAAAETFETNEALESSIAAANGQWAKYGASRPRLRGTTLAGDDSSPYVRRIVSGFEAKDSSDPAKGRYTFWNQSSLRGGKSQCFNAYTPKHAVCGCVATAGSAILQFFNCTNDPGEVTSTKTSINDVTTPYTTRAGATDWSVLPAALGGENASITVPDADGYDLLGRVAYNMGVLVDMSWTTRDEGSGAQTEKLAAAFKKYGFKTARYVKYSGSPTTDGKEFMKTLYAQLWCGAPAVLSIHGTPGGHAVVACGYARDADGDDFCRVFMGWGGTGDSWYKFPQVEDFTQVNGAVTMLGYEDDAVVPVYGETNIPGEDLTLPGYLTNGVPVTVPVNSFGYFGIRVPIGLEDKTITYAPSGKSTSIAPFDKVVISNESSARPALDEALPNELYFPIMNMTVKQTIASARAVAERDGKALLLVCGSTGSDAMKPLTGYITYLDSISDLSNRFVYVVVNSKAAGMNERDGDPVLGVFDPVTFDINERWKDSNGRLEYTNFLDTDATGEIGSQVLVYSSDLSVLTNMVDVIIEDGYVEYQRRNSGITVTVRGANLATGDFGGEGTAVPDYGTVMNVWTNGEFAVFSASGSYTNESAGVIYSCVGWTTSEVSKVSQITNYTAGAVANIQLFSDDNVTLTWVWDASHYRVTATPVCSYNNTGLDWSSAVTPSESWVAAGTRATVTASPSIGTYGFSYWEVDGKVDYFNEDKRAEVGLYENGSSVIFYVNEPVTVKANYDPGQPNVPAATVNTITFKSSPEEVAASVPLPVDGGFVWGANTTQDGVFRILWDEAASYTDSTGGVWVCTGVEIKPYYYDLGNDACQIGSSPAEVTLIWELQSDPTPPTPTPPTPTPPTPSAITITGIAQTAGGTWTITVSPATKDCWYWLYATDDLSKVAGAENTWTAPVVKKQQATEDGPLVFSGVSGGTGKLFWRAKATSTEDGN